MGLLKRDPSAGGIVRHTERANFRDWLLRRGTKLEDAFAVTRSREAQRQAAKRISRDPTVKIPPRKRKKPTKHMRHMAAMRRRQRV